MSLRKLMERDLFIPLNWPCKPQNTFKNASAFMQPIDAGDTRMSCSIIDCPKQNKPPENI